MSCSSSARPWSHALSLASCLLLLAACCFPGSARPTVKIGLSAPFEGRYRYLGYEVLYAVRLAVRQRNEAGGVGSRYLVEMVALNDMNEPQEAVLQAHEMAADPDLLATIGGWTPATAQAAAPEYQRLGLAFVAPTIDLAQGPPPSDAPFADAYRALSGGASPGPAAAWAYAEANRLLDAFDAAIRTEGRPDRAAVQAQLSGRP